jgi:hypothetical protein
MVKDPEPKIDSIEPDPESKINIDYQSILQNDAVKNIMNLLSITQNVGSILEAEKIVFWLTCASGRYIEVEGRKYKRRSMTYEVYDDIMQSNQTFNDFKRSNGTDLKTISTMNFNLTCKVLRLIYGITEHDFIKRNWDQFLPISDGELFKIVNEYYNNWDLKPIMDHISEVISYTKRNLANDVLKRDELYTKAKDENEKEEEIQIKNPEPIDVVDGTPFTKRIKPKQTEAVEEEHNIKIDNNNVLSIE